MDEFRKLVKFEFLKPDNFLGLIQPGLTLQSLLEKSQVNFSASLEASGVQSSNFFVSMAVYISILLVFVVVLLILKVLKHFKQLKSKIEPLFKKILKATVWNNTIRSVTISYLETAISFHVSCQTIE